MGQSYVGRLEQQNKELKQQLADAKAEVSVHLEALEIERGEVNGFHEKSQE